MTFHGLMLEDLMTLSAAADTDTSAGDDVADWQLNKIIHTQLRPFWLAHLYRQE